MKYVHMSPSLCTAVALVTRGDSEHVCDLMASTASLLPVQARHMLVKTGSSLDKRDVFFHFRLSGALEGLASWSPQPTPHPISSVSQGEPAQHFPSHRLPLS